MIPFLRILPFLAAFAVAQPVKLDVRIPPGSVAPGARTSVTIGLLDANNRPAATAKAMQFTVKARLPSGEEKPVGTATIPAGQTAATVDVQGFDKEGVAYIWATNPEVRSGGGYLRVKSISRAIAIKGVVSPAKALPQVIAPPAPPIPNAKGLKNAKIAAMAKIHPSIAIMAKEVIHPGPGAPPAPTPTPSPAATPDSAPPVSPPGRYQIVLGYSPQGSFLADGKDSATVHAFAFSDDGSPAPEFKLVFKDGSGTLNPKPLIIREGAEEGTATLTYNRVGDVTVEYVTSTPTATVEDRKLSIHFGPPITQQILNAPDHMSFLDTADIGVSLADARGTTTDTDADREAMFLVSGQGELSAPRVTIKGDSNTATVRFTPQSWGNVTITSKIDQLADIQKTINVDPPYQLLGLATFGGLMGGFIFILRNREAPKWRIPVGAVTGLMLVWAMLMLGMNTLPRSVVLNPLSLVMIATLGGWAGTELFDPILKKLGFGGAPPPEKKP